MYHAKQSLVLFIMWVAIAILSTIPVIGWFVIIPLGNLFVLILWIFGIVNALTLKEKPLPLIGKWALKFTF